MDKRLITIWMVSGLMYGGMVAAEEEALLADKESPIKVNVSGAPEALAENLKAYLPSLRNLKCDSPTERADRFIDASDEKLVEGAEAMGYFSATFNMTAAREQNCWVLNIAVQPGEPVRVRKRDFKLSGEGQSLDEFKEIMSELPYAEGDPFINRPYEDFKSSLKNAANRFGFFDAEFVTRQVTVNIDTRTADIDLHFNTGERYRIGKVTAEQDVLAERYLNRYINLTEGDIYNSDDLLEQRRLLESSGYYEDVQVSSRFGQAKDKQVPVEISTLRRKRYTYTANVGYATDTDIRIEGGMQTHWVNERGHKLDAKVRLSQNDPGVGLAYKVPLWEPEHEFASASIDWNMSDNNDIKGEKLELEFNYNRRTESDWQQTAFISFLNESTKVVGEPASRSQLTLVGARVNKTVSNDALFPTDGWRLQAEVKGAHENLLSDLTLLQASVDGKYLHSFEHKGKVIFRGEFGTSLIDEFDQLPKSLRFFAGGQNSVRGYDFESIGEKNVEGNVIGGKHRMVLSGEYEYPVTEKISVAAFTDVGTAFDEWNDYGFSVGLGVGARYKSPLGPIRVDFAVPKDDTSDLHFYFSLGPDL